MCSANGQVLVVSRGGYTHEFRAYWEAPFFVMIDDGDAKDRPLMIHCENAAHAATHMRQGSDFRLFAGDFTEFVGPLPPH